MQSSLKTRPYRAIIENSGSERDYIDLLRDLARCARECGWNAGTLALYGAGSDVPVVVLHFGASELRLLPWQGVALALLAARGRTQRLLIKAWPSAVPAGEAGAAGWEWVLTRVLPPASSGASAQPRTAALRRRARRA